MSVVPALVSTPDLSAEAQPSSPSPLLQAALSYWRSKLRGRRMPSRSDLDPLEMRPWLPQTILVEPVDDGADFRIRLAGTDVREKLGYEVTGRLLSTLPTAPDVVQAVLADFREAAESGLPSCRVHQHYNPVMNRPVRFERLIAPLSEDGTNVNMLFAVRRDLLGGVPISPLERR